MNLDLPIKVRAGEDVSGTPFGLLEQKRAGGRLGLITNRNEGLEPLVLVEHAFGDLAQKQTGYERFVEFRKPVQCSDGGFYRHALYVERFDGVELPQEATFATNAEQATAQAQALTDERNARDGWHADKAANEAEIEARSA